MKRAISVGDTVEQARHYVFGDGGIGATIVDGPDPNIAGTKWRVRLIGETAPEVTTPAGWQYSGPGSDRSFVEVELLEGECREADWQAAMKTGKFDQFIARQPGHVRQLANSPGYEMNFPGRGPLQQFYDEWETVDSDS